jgi:glutathione synthase/RimK-type ligase-like ATP-grasp enzyme
MATLLFREMMSAAAKALDAHIDWHPTQPTGRSVGFLRQGLVTVPLYGNVSPLNCAPATRLAGDKVMAYEVLRSAGIPAIPHEAVSQDNPVTVAEDLCRRLGLPLVLKPYAGTNGVAVERLDSEEAVAQHLWSWWDGGRAGELLAASPWREVTEEYRVILLDGVALMRYAKQRAVGEWRHNLAQGATPVLYDLTHPRAAAVDGLGARAAARIGLRFCSVDVAEVNGQLVVMEVNAGVSLDQIAGMNPGYQAKATDIFRMALDRYLTGSHVLACDS